MDYEFNQNDATQDARIIAKLERQIVQWITQSRIEHSNWTTMAALLGIDPPYDNNTLVRCEKEIELLQEQGRRNKELEEQVKDLQWRLDELRD